MRAEVFIATSLDGFIAGPDDDLSWLPQAPPGEDFGYGAFMSSVGALLMGRRTFDVVSGFDVPWPYGDTPVCVATHRPLPEAPPEGAALHPASGSIEGLLEAAQALAGDGVIYLDGGDIIRQALVAQRVTRLTLTVVPVLLGAGTSLFAGLASRQRLTLESSTALHGGLVQLVYRA